MLFIQLHPELCIIFFDLLRKNHTEPYDCTWYACAVVIKLIFYATQVRRFLFLSMNFNLFYCDRTHAQTLSAGCFLQKIIFKPNNGFNIKKKYGKIGQKICKAAAIFFRIFSGRQINL